MAAPTYAWPSIDSSELQTLTGLPEDGLLDKVLKRLQFLRELAVNSTTVTEVPHRHGELAPTAEGRILAWDGGNLLRQGSPDNDHNGSWVRAGFGDRNSDDVQSASTAGSYLRQVVFGNQAHLSMLQPGGASMVASVYLRAASKLSAGEVSFGVADNAGTFNVGGYEAAVPYSQLRGGWQRFFSVLDDVGNSVDWSTELTYLVRIGTTFLDPDAEEVEIQSTGFMLSLGSVLTPYGLCYAGKTHRDWSSLPVAPLFDERVAKHDAVFVEAA